jgi:putative ABC transport system permease protein
MNFIKQFLGILGVSLAGVTQRLGSALTIVIGVACAVGALVAMLAMGVGATQQIVGESRPDRILVTSAGSRGGMMSSIPKDEAATVHDLPGIRKGATGEPVVVFQSFVPIEGRRRGTGVRIYFPLIGVTPNITDFSPEMRFTEGRMFKSGLQELIASNPCVRQFTDFEVGAQRRIHGASWTVVGHFNQGKTQQCVVFADVGIINSTFLRNSYSEVLVRLQSPADYTALRDAVTSNPTLHLDVEHESDANERQSKEINGILNFVSYFVGAIMAIGATLGAVNSLYAMVDSRRRELATLRAMGFGSGAIVASILCESVVLALPGALLGCLLAWALFNGLAVSPFGFNFQLKVTAYLAVLGVIWALAMGLIGGLLPALRAARLPVTTALRAT